MGRVKNLLIAFMEGLLCPSPYDTWLAGEVEEPEDEEELPF